MWLAVSRIRTPPAKLIQSEPRHVCPALQAIPKSCGSAAQVPQPGPLRSRFRSIVPPVVRPIGVPRAEKVRIINRIERCMTIEPSFKRNVIWKPVTNFIGFLALSENLTKCPIGGLFSTSTLLALSVVRSDPMAGLRFAERLAKTGDFSQAAPCFSCSRMGLGSC